MPDSGMPLSRVLHTAVELIFMTRAFLLALIELGLVCGTSISTSIWLNSLTQGWVSTSRKARNSVRRSFVDEMNKRCSMRVEPTMVIRTHTTFAAGKNCQCIGSGRWVWIDPEVLPPEQRVIGGICPLSFLPSLCGSWSLPLSILIWSSLYLYFSHLPTLFILTLYCCL